MSAAKGVISQSRAPWRGTLLLSALLVAGSFCIALGRSHGHWYLVPVGLIPLFASIRFLRPTAAMAGGACWGFCLFIFLGILGDAATSQGLKSICALTVIPALYAYVGAKLTRQVGFSPYLLALAWMGAEFALSVLGFRDGLLAATQTDTLVLQWVGNFAGAVLAAFLVAYVAALLFKAAGVVYVAATQRRYTTISSSAVRRFRRFGESLSELFLFIRQAHPRAPPLTLR